MKIALYGMPCAGKSTLMDRITDAKVINGSQELRRICGGSFLELSEEEKHQVRIKYTEYINGLNDEVIVSDGHYSFMETVAFTEADGELYDIFIYLYCSPENLKERYALSEKNGKFAGESIESLRQWQEFEINNLREECHRRNKDFYVVSDNEEEQNKFFDFLSLLREGFSSYDLATDICNQIMEQFNKQDILYMVDGDKTIIIQDSYRFCCNGKTKIFDGDFYTGYQSFLFEKELQTASIDKSEFVKLVVIFCNNEDKGEHFMSTRKTIGGALGAIIVLIVAQILAQLVASLFVLVKIPEGICNIIAGIIYVGLAFVLSELFSKRLLKIKIENLGMPKFSIKAKWIIVGVLLPVIVKAVYLFFFSGKYVSSGMNSNQIFSTLSAGIAFTGIAAGFVEEMVFRGVILNLLKEKWNIKVAVLIPSVLFGLVHIIGMDFSIISSLLVLIAGTMVGIMFSMVAIESGSVWNSGIVHSLWNILIIGGGLSISEKADEYSVMTYVLDSKDFVFTGGEFGIESSIIALLGYVIVTLAAICMIKKKAKV